MSRPGRLIQSHLPWSQGCNEPFPRSEHDQHVQACFGPRGSKDGRQVLELQAQSFQGVMRLSMLCGPRATIADLDRVLRSVWMEPCCNHESVFGIHDPEAGAPPEFSAPAGHSAFQAPVVCFPRIDDEREGRKRARREEHTPKTKGGNTTLFKRFQYRNEVLFYQYGTYQDEAGGDLPATVSMVLVGGRKKISPVWYEAVEQSQSGILLVVRNEVPAIPCGVCPRGASLATHALSSADGIESLGAQDFFCSRHRPAGAPSSVLANSPRAGACVYHGEEPSPARGSEPAPAKARKETPAPETPRTTEKKTPARKTPAPKTQRTREKKPSGKRPEARSPAVGVRGGGIDKRRGAGVRAAPATPAMEPSPASKGANADVPSPTGTRKSARQAAGIRRPKTPEEVIDHDQTISFASRSGPNPWKHRGKAAQLKREATGRAAGQMPGKEGGPAPKGKGGVGKAKAPGSKTPAATKPRKNAVNRDEPSGKDEAGWGKRRARRATAGPELGKSPDAEMEEDTRAGAPGGEHPHEQGGSLLGGVLGWVRKRAGF